MKQWKRASLEMPCGAERACSILPDEPYLVLSRDGWRKVRCARHAGHAIPAVIPDAQPPAPRPVTVPTFTALATSFDARKAAANDGD
jgi:hypothetical protein